MDRLIQIKALFIVRLRLLFNSLKSKAGLSKLIGIGLISFITILATASGASDILEAIFKLPYSNIIAEWGIGLLVLYGIFVVFTGDLVSGHTLNTGQMSSDFHFLSTLPVSPTILIITKIFERTITDYFGILFLLPALIGISCYKAYTINAFLAAILMFFEISILIGILLNLVNITLIRFFKPSTINNFYSIFGYVSAILTLIPFLMVSNFNPSQLPKVLDVMAYLQDNVEWLMLPIKWLGIILINSTPFCSAFVKITILWFVLISILVVMFHFAVKNNWFTYVHSSKAVSKSLFHKKLLTGIFWKEWLMLKSDFNLLINSIFMPISIIAIEIYFLKQVFSLTSMYSIMNFIFGSIIYFSMFGPINIIGYEGKAISLLETMPITPAQFIKKKYSFWVLIALIIFIPSTIVTFRILHFDWEVTLEAVLMTFLFTMASVWVSVCLSAISAKYDTAVLQQHSTFFGKTAAVALTSIILPIKNLSWINFYSLLIFLILTSLCYLKAQNCLKFRQDKDMLESDNFLLLNSFILLMCFIAFENNIKQMFYSMIPDIETGIWTWILSVGAMFIFFIIFRRKNISLFPKITKRAFCRVLLISTISCALTYVLFLINSQIYYNLIFDFSQIIGFFSILSIIKPIWSVIVLLILTLFMISVNRRIEESIYTENTHNFCKFMGFLLAVLIMPKNLMLPTVIFLITLQFLKTKEDNHAIVTYSSFVYFISLFSYLIIY